MNKRADIPKVSQYVVGIIILGMVVTGLFSMLGNAWGQEPELVNSTTARENLEALNNTMGGILGDVNRAMVDVDGDIRGDTEQDENVWGAFGFVDALFSSVWGTMKLIGGSLNFMTLVFTILTGESSLFGIPAWVGTGIVTLVIVIMVFGLVRIVTKREL